MPGDTPSSPLYGLMGHVAAPAALGPMSFAIVRRLLRPAAIRIHTGPRLFPTNPGQQRSPMKKFAACLAACLLLAFCTCVTAQAAQSLASASHTVEEDRALIEKLQHDTFLYMWEYSFPSGMVRESSREYPDGPAAVGGTGFGVAALVVGVERGWVSREAALNRLLTLTDFLLNRTDRKQLHGAFPHWIDGYTGATRIFGADDIGADLVETAFLMEGLLIARAYFDGDGDEATLRARITELWEDIDWNWFTNGENNGLYWHWSAETGFTKGMKITGFNEAMIAYVLALSSPTHPIAPEALSAWYSPEEYQNRHYYGHDIEGAIIYTGPLFIIHYSFIGLDPRELADSHVTKGYWTRNVTQALINRAYCLYLAHWSTRFHDGFWGLTSSETPTGYLYSSPVYESATVAPTAALASMPYVPEYAMRVLWDIRKHHPSLWSLHGPRDAYSQRDDWASPFYIAIDKLPIVCMVENYRSGLLWKLFMGIPEIQAGLKRGGFSTPPLVTGFPRMVVPCKPGIGKSWVPDACDLRRHPDTGRYAVSYAREQGGPVTFTLQKEDGTLLFQENLNVDAGHHELLLPDTLTAGTDVLTLTMKAGHETHTLPIRLN